MTLVMHDANGNLYLAKGSKSEASSSPFIYSHTPFMNSPPIVFTRPQEMHQYGSSSQNILPGFAYQQHSLIQKEAARNGDDLNRVTFSPSWCCTLIIVIIGLFFCPLVSSIGLAFAKRARDLDRETSAEVKTRGVVLNAPRHTGLSDAEKYNSVACHLGVAAIISGAIIIASIVAVVLFLFLSDARILVTNTV